MRLRNIFVVCWTLYQGGCAKILVKSATLPVSGGQLSYLIARPTEVKRRPVVLYLPDASCESVAGVLESLSGLRDTGYTVVIPELRGVKPGAHGACSAEFLAAHDRPTRLADLSAVITHMSSIEPRWDGRWVILAGAEGGILAPELAVKHHPTGVVLFGFGAWDLAHVISRVSSGTMLARGSGWPLIDREVSQLTRRFQDIDSHPTTDQTWETPAKTYRWWASYLHYAPMQFLVQLTMPIYLLNGTADNRVPIEAADSVSIEFTRLSKDNIGQRRYMDLDYRWNDPAGANHLREVIDEMVLWIRNVMPVS